MAQPSRRLAVLIVLLWGCLPGLHARPQYWVDPTINSAGTATYPACDVHPSSPVGIHPKIEALDASASLLLTLNDAPAPTVCPGQTYAVQVTFPEPRRALLTASSGTFASTTTPQGRQSSFYTLAASSKALRCPNRVIIGNLAKVASITDSLQVPCDVTGDFVLRITSSAAPGSPNLQQTSATVPVDRACATPACAPAVAAPGSSPRASSSPTASPEAHTASSPAAVVTAPVDAPAPSSAQGNANCQTSELGYACKQQIGQVTLHYTVGGAMPVNPCTSGASLGNTLPATSGTAASDSLLHMAVQGNTNGYVGFAFAQTPGKMTGSNAILGWRGMDGSAPFVSTYQLEGDFITDSNAAAWASYAGVMRTGSALTVCFTRNLTEPAAVYSQNINPSADTKVNWAVGGQQALVQHSAAAGGSINLATGAATETKSKTKARIRAHGALMAVAWALLFPLGAFLPRHRWIVGNKQACGKHVWFSLHVVCQTSAMMLTIISISIAWYWLEAPDSSTGTAHKVLGTIAFSMACLQWLTAFARPAPDHPRRPAFNFLHHWLGRLTILIAWSTIYLGIHLFHTGIYKANLAAWVAPVASVMGTLLLLELLLTILGRGRQVSITRNDHPATGLPTAGSFAGDAVAELSAVTARSKYPPPARV